ncbi:zinc finger BED domain-containing protein 4-like [Ciona intestinalis]
MSSTSKSSSVWKYFEVMETDTSTTVCNLCNVSISRGKSVATYTTNSMIKHLLLKHQIDVRKQESGALSQSNCGKRPTAQQTIEGMFAKKQCFSTTHPVAQKITKLICEMVAADFLPFSVVENEGFRRLITELQPRYNIPSRKYITETCMPEIYTQVRQYIKHQVNNSMGCFAGTTDIWTSIQNIAYMSLTIHFVSCDKGNLRLLSYVLSCNELEGSHTAQHILEEIKHQEALWDIQLRYMVSDNAANVVKALRDGEIKGVRCMAHTINLVVHHALKNSQRTVNDTVAVARRIVTHFHHSPRACGMLKSVQMDLNLPKHKLIQDVPTRWNSTFFMLERLLEQKPAINQLYQTHGEFQNLSFNEWKLVDSLTIVLKMFDKATCELSGEAATISHILPIKVNLVRKLKRFEHENAEGRLFGIGTFISVLKEQLEHRFSKPHRGVPQAKDCYFYNDDVYTTCAVAAILDPRFKTSWLDDTEEVTRLSTAIQQLALQNVSSENTGVDAGEHLSSTDDSGNEDSILFECPLSDDQIVDTETTPGLEQNAEQQKNKIKTTVMRYIGSQRIKSSKSPLDFWMDHRVDCPALFSLAVSLLSCPPTSVSSERLFSSSGVIVSPLRNRLKPKNVEVLKFLHYNLRKLNFLY